MKRVGILTAGGDTPAMNAMIHGAVPRACERRIGGVGFSEGFGSLCHARFPHVRLNLLFRTRNRTRPYHSVNVDINKRIRFVE